MGTHFCDPDKWMADCVEYMRSQNPKYRQLKETRWYMNNSEPRVTLSLTKWTHLRIISQAKIFRIVTFDDVTDEVTGMFSYDLVYFGFMNENDFNGFLKSYKGVDRGPQLNLFTAYDKDQSKLEAHQFR